MALAGALVAHAVRRRRLHQRSLRAQVAGLLGAPYSRGQMTYDLRRLRLKGLIARLPHSNTYRLTPDGLRVAVFYVKVHDRLLTPLIAADAPPGPPELRHALTTIDRHINDFTAKARIGT